jgi:hypothetical protein
VTSPQLNADTELESTRVVPGSVTMTSLVINVTIQDIIDLEERNNVWDLKLLMEVYKNIRVDGILFCVFW